MFKDPYQLEETPYELLGLEPNASPKEVQEALPRFMRDRKNLPRLALAQQAIRKLKTPADRALLDIWLYNVEATPDEGGPEVDMSQALAGFRKVPCYPVEELYSDLSGLDLSKEQREIQFKKMEFGDLKQYDELRQVDLTPEFDR
jgi:hypothetical protein